MPTELSAGMWRGLMLQGGRGARLSLKRAYPGSLVDAPTLDMAHAGDGAARAAALGATHALLVFSWGLPPELDEVDRVGFGRVARLYRDAGLGVLAGVMASSYVPQASYAERNWAARDVTGRRIPAQIGRLYACWNDAEWLATVERHLIQALDAGIEGVWLMAPWAGGVPLAADGGLLGGAGCACPRCRAAYAEAAGGAEIPRLPTLRARPVQHYLEWRASLTARRIGEWAAAARAHRPDALFVAEGPPVPGGLAALQYGHDPAAIGAHVDLYLVRDSLAEPRGLAGPGVALAAARARLGPDAQAASLLGAARSTSGTTDTPHAWTRAGSVAAALACPPVIDGTGFVAGRTLTLLLETRYQGLRAALAEFNGWIEAQRGWLGARTGAGPLAIYCPPAFTWWKNDPVEPVFEAACAAVIQMGLPLRVVGDETWDGVETLIVPPGPVAGLDARLIEFGARGGRVIALQQMRSGSAGRPLWTAFQPLKPGRAHWPVVRRAAHRTALIGVRWRGGGTVRRRAARWLRLPGASPDATAAIQLPGVALDELATALGADFRPRVRSAQPVLFTIWREPGGGTQWHLVNSAPEPQRVTLITPEFISGWVIAPEQGEPVKVFGSDVVIPLEAYKVLRLPPQGA